MRRYPASEGVKADAVEESYKKAKSSQNKRRGRGPVSMQEVPKSRLFRGQLLYQRQVEIALGSPALDAF